MFENKIFKGFKSLFFASLLVICVLLSLCLVFVWIFGFKPYKVVTGSMEPSIQVDDIVIVKKRNAYSVGDVIKFQNGQLPTTHRIKEIKSVNGETIYICHGDANPDMRLEEVSAQNVEGRVVLTLPQFGVYTDYVNQHKFALFALLIGIYCIIGTIENQAEINYATKFSEIKG